MKPLEKLTQVVTPLPRGGFLVDTPHGYIQFGIPPETIKDTMMLPQGTPGVFVLPVHFFNWMKGISVAELEFPIYYNFFIRKKKTVIICLKKETDRLISVLSEALFGPDEPELKDDYIPDYTEVPDIKPEMDYFRTMELNDVVEFRHFTDGKCDIDNVNISIDSADNFTVSVDGDVIAFVPGIIEYKPRYLIGERLAEPFKPPLFAVTCLGSSSGFDPSANTSGFIIWLNHRGIMIDPPVNSTEWLLDSNVSPKHIDSIILTHCHADHDAGTFQKILQEEKVTVYTTKTILNSFLRKYSALTGVDSSFLLRLFTFVPLELGKPFFINDGCFDFFYTLHSIPTIGFRLSFQKDSLTYSSDHNADPELHKKLLDEGRISRKRYDELQAFPWDSTIVYHESGVAPLHTPVEYLSSLSEEKKKKITVYHIPESSIPEKAKLTPARFGIENTYYFKTETSDFDGAYQLLNILRHIDFAEDMPISKAQDFLNLGFTENFNKGAKIIESGTVGSRFFIIHSGNVLIKSKDGKYTKVLGPYDYFGETALLINEERTADVTALTEVSTYSIRKDKFLSFIKGTDFEKTLRNLARIRDLEAWETLSSSRAITYCTPTQRNHLESILEPAAFQAGHCLIAEGTLIDSIYIIREGRIAMLEQGTLSLMLRKGDLAGSTADFYERRPSIASFYCEDDVKLYRIQSEHLFPFLEKNPGLYMKFRYYS